MQKTQNETGMIEGAIAIKKVGGAGGEQGDPLIGVYRLA